MAVAKALLVGTCIASLGVLLHCVGIVSPQWMKIDIYSIGEENYGLFKWCPNYLPYKCHDLNRSQDMAVQAMALLGILTGIAGVSLAIVFMNLVRRGRNPAGVIRQASGLLCVAASVFLFICVIVYGAKIYKDKTDVVSLYGVTSLHYAFGLTTAGGVLLLLGGSVIVAIGG